MVTFAEAEDVLQTSQTLLAASQRLWKKWAALFVEVRERRGIRAFTGAGDAFDVAHLIFQQNLCLPCLMQKTGLDAFRVTDLLTAFVRVMRLNVDEGTCAGCGETKVVHGIT